MDQMYGHIFFKKNNRMESNRGLKRAKDRIVAAGTGGRECNEGE